jgi:hypothetical protein
MSATAAGVEYELRLDCKAYVEAAAVVVRYELRLFWSDVRLDSRA